MVSSLVKFDVSPVPKVKRPDTDGAPGVCETVGNPESRTPLFSEDPKRKTGFWTIRVVEIVVGPEPPSKYRPLSSWGKRRPRIPLK